MAGAAGAIGTPILTLAGVTRLPVDTLSAMVGRQLPFFAVLVPFWLICRASSWPGPRPGSRATRASFCATAFGTRSRSAA